MARTLLENVTLLKRDVLFLFLFFVVTLLLAFGVGYFAGFQDQMALARGVAEMVGDVNGCFLP